MRIRKKILTVLLLAGVMMGGCFNEKTSIEKKNIESNIEAEKGKRFVDTSDPNAKYFVGFGEDVVTGQAKPTDPRSMTGVTYYSSELREGEFEPTSLTVGYIENQSTLKKCLSKTVSVDVKGEVFTWPVIASWEGTNTSDLTITENSILIYARQHIFVGKYGISSERLTESGTNAIKASIKNFISDNGNVYRKDAYVSADLMYIYKYTLSSSDLAKKDEVKAALKIAVDLIYGQAQTTLSNEQKAIVSRTSKQIYQVTNIANYGLRTIDSFEAWKLEEQRFNDYVQNKENIKFLQPMKMKYAAYSDIANVPVEYQTILNNVINYNTWKTAWNSHKNKLTDIRDLTTNVTLKQDCINAIAVCETQIGKINSYDSIAKAPAADEFKSIYDTWRSLSTIFTGFQGWTWNSSAKLIDDNSEIYLGNVDGDTAGKVDLITKGQPGAPNAGYIYVGLSNGTGFSAWTWNSNVRVVDDKARICIGDVNGDGKADIVTVGQPGAANEGVVYVGLSKPGIGFTGFEFWTWNSGVKMIDNNSEIYLADVDGDGRADLVTKGQKGATNAGYIYVGLSKHGTSSIFNGFENWTWNSNGRIVDDKARICLGDVNNDGCADLVTVGESGATNAGVVYVGLSKPGIRGAAFTGFNVWKWNSGNKMIDDNSDIYLGDVNRDGRVDLVTKGQSGATNAGYIYVGLSKPGTDFNGFENWTYNTGGRLVDDYKYWVVDKTTTWNTHWATSWDYITQLTYSFSWKARICIGDVSGDGRADLVTAGEPSASNAGFVYTGFSK